MKIFGFGAVQNFAVTHCDRILVREILVRVNFGAGKCCSANKGALALGALAASAIGQKA